MSNSVTKGYNISLLSIRENTFFFTVVIFLASSPDAILHAQVALLPYHSYLGSHNYICNHLFCITALH